MRLSRPCLVSLLATGLLSAQFPGQYPGGYPPGSRNPNGYPGSGGTMGGGLPKPRLPGRGKNKKDTADKKKPSEKEVLQEFTGTITGVEKDTFTIRATDSRDIQFRSTETTKYLSEDKPVERTLLQPGAEVGIEARANDEGYFFAVNVTVKKAAAGKAKAPVETAAKVPASPTAPKQESAAVEEEPEAPAIKATTIKGPDQEEPDVPRLRRGKPAPRPRRAGEEAAVAENAPVPPTVSGEVAMVNPPPLPRAAAAPEAADPDPFLTKAIEVANDFGESLPNYLCNQLTTRFQGQGRPLRWQPLDIVSASVVYRDGVESYQDIKINNKPTKKPMEEMGGSWSRGEFGTTLRDLFSPATNADFRRKGESSASGREAIRYDFNVEQPNSHWQTVIGGQSVRPAYKGAVWIDKKTWRVLRIEMEAIEVPKSFPLDTIEWVVDYAYVRIGTAEFLLPAHAENLACWRGTGQCARNAIDFRNYRKFTSESQIMTTDSSVSFEGEEKPAAAPTPAPAPASKGKKK